MVQHGKVKLEDGIAEIYDAQTSVGALVICAAHSVGAYRAGTAALLSGLSGARVVCVNLHGIGNCSPRDRTSLEAMVSDLERVRMSLGIEQ